MAPDLSTICRGDVPGTPVHAVPTLYTALRDLVRGQPEGEPKLTTAERLGNAHIALEQASSAAERAAAAKTREAVLLDACKGLLHIAETGVMSVGTVRLARAVIAMCDESAAELVRQS